MQVRRSLAFLSFTVSVGRMAAEPNITQPPVAGSALLGS